MKEKIEERIKKAEEELKEARKELKSYKESKYQVVEFGTYNWYVIDEDDDTKTLFMKDKMSSKEIEALFDDEFLDNDKDVIFSLYNNKWRDSIIRATLNTKFLACWDRDELRPMTTYLNGIETVDYVRLITKEEVEKLPEEIRKCSGRYGYWTLTPMSGNTYYVFNVRSSGSVNDYFANITYGVRPVIQVLESEL